MVSCSYREDPRDAIAPVATREDARVCASATQRAATESLRRSRGLPQAHFPKFVLTLAPVLALASMSVVFGSRGDVFVDNRVFETFPLVYALRVTGPKGAHGVLPDFTVAMAAEWRRGCRKPPLKEGCTERELADELQGFGTMLCFRP